MRDLLRTMTFVISLLLLSSSTAEAQLLRRKRPKATGKSVSFEHAGLDREYRIHVPSSAADPALVPLVVFLHGGGGTSRQSSSMGLTKLSDLHGFIVVYPNAIDKHWNDGRVSPRFVEHDKTINDVEFIASLVQQLKKQYSIDSSKVFAAGISNGGFMTQRLAIERSEIFSAVGIITASMGEPLKYKFSPTKPVSVLYMNGTEDPLVPYNGGEIKVDLFPRLNRALGRSTTKRGKCIPTNEAVALWVKRNGITTSPTVRGLADKEPYDGSTIELTMWERGQQETAVALYKVVGGGHNIPGGIQYLPQRIIGRTNRDIEGFEILWQFFRRYARKPA